VASRVVGRTFVKLHDDVAQKPSEFASISGVKKQLVAVDGRRKRHAFFQNTRGLPSVPPTRPENAAVGQYGLNPSFQSVTKSAEFLEVHPDRTSTGEM
jgi:hypothetical protein